MSGITPYPSEDIIDQIYRLSPEIMHPNRVPLAVILEGFITAERCYELSEKISTDVDPFHHEGCSAATREVGMTSEHEDFPHLSTIMYVTHSINHQYFEYDLDEDSYSWLQTYFAGDSYPMHIDYAPGRSRKLTSITLLTDEAEYDGGELELITGSDATLTVPRTQGTMVVFPSWLMHRVHPITRGVRKSLNMGFHGPAFR